MEQQQCYTRVPIITILQKNFKCKNAIFASGIILTHAQTLPIPFHRDRCHPHSWNHSLFYVSAQFRSPGSVSPLD
jgi:hypothetical protein